MTGALRPPSVILLRGAPGVGKSTAARGLLAALGHGAVVEVDHLRGAQARCDWHDRRQHQVALDVAAQCAEAYARCEVVPVVLVDTFCRDALPRMQADLEGRHLDHVTVSLWAQEADLEARAARRGDGDPERALAALMNAEVQAVRWPRETLLDTTGIAPNEVVSMLLAHAGWGERGVATTP